MQLSDVVLYGWTYVEAPDDAIKTNSKQPVQLADLSISQVIFFKGGVGASH